MYPGRRLGLDCVSFHQKKHVFLKNQAINAEQENFGKVQKKMKSNTLKTQRTMRRSAVRCD